MTVLVSLVVDNQHDIAEASELVASLQSLLVALHDDFVTTECAC